MPTADARNIYGPNDGDRGQTKAFSEVVGLMPVGTGSPRSATSPAQYPEAMADSETPRVDRAVPVPVLVHGQLAGDERRSPFRRPRADPADQAILRRGVEELRAAADFEIRRLVEPPVSASTAPAAPIGRAAREQRESADPDSAADQGPFHVRPMPTYSASPSFQPFFQASKSGNFCRRKPAIWQGKNARAQRLREATRIELQ